MQHGQPDGFLALPPAGKGSPVLVLHAWWGLNDTMRTFCTRLAEAGFVAFAPDLYHGKVADTIPDAEALAAELQTRQDQARASIAEAANFLLERSGESERGLAVIGFSLGAYYALNLAATRPQDVRSVVIYYGAGEGDFTNSKAAFLGHFAEKDDYEDQEFIDAMEVAIRQAGRPLTFYSYPGTQHWFAEPDRTQAYHAEAANLAWERTLAFLKR